MYTQTEKVNIEPKSYLPVFRISQNDVGRTLKAHLVSDEGTIAIPTSATVTMAGIKPSGLGYTVTGTINGSDVSFETDATMTDEAGQIQSEIRIVVGETLIGTTNVILNIEPNPHPSDTTDGQREPLVNEITALLNQITAQADRVEEYSSKVLNMTVSAHESQEPTVTKTEGEVINLDFGLPRGEKGERGERGEQGEAGKDGKDGLDGKDGKDGKDGINGVTPDFSIGTVTTLEPTASASVTLTGTEEEPVLNFGIPRGVKGEQGDVSLSDLEKIMVTDTASGAIASFPDGSDLLPAKSLTATIAPKQSGTGTPSPDNVRPISGWESVNVFDTGKNLLPNKKAQVGAAQVIVGDDVASITGSQGFYLPVGTFTMLINATKTCSVYWVDKTTGANSRIGITNTPIQINVTASGYYLALLYNGGGIAVSEVNEAQIELGTTATAYEPCTATTHTTDLGRTVYGGTVDVVSGQLVDNMAIVDGGTLNWSYDPNWHGFVATIADFNNPNAYNVLPNLICEKYETKVYNGTSPCITSWVGLGAHLVLIRDDNYTDATAFKTAMDGVQLCYELAEPQTYQLTPQQINTLQGVNNVWVDCGDCSIEYYADTKLYIDKKLGGN